MGTVSSRIRQKVDRAGYRVVEAGWARALHHERSDAKKRWRDATARVYDLEAYLIEVERERDQWHARYDAAIRASTEEN